MCYYFQANIKDQIMPKIQGDYLICRWHISDVQNQAEHLTDEEARTVLEHISNNHDANDGVNWDVIDAAIEAVIPFTGGYCGE